MLLSEIFLQSQRKASATMPRAWVLHLQPWEQEQRSWTEADIMEKEEPAHFILFKAIKWLQNSIIID